MTVEGEGVDGVVRRRPGSKGVGIIVVAVLAAVSGVWLLRGAVPPTEDGGHLSVALTDFEGGGFTLDSYRGRPIVVNFWASWCPNCAAEMPAFERAHQRFDGSVEFVGVNHTDRRSSAEELAASTGVTYRLADDPEAQLFKEFGGRGMPTTAFIDADGAIAEVVVGQLSEEQLASRIKEHFEVSS